MERKEQTDLPTDGGKCLRVFHFSEGSAHKFWSVAVEGAMQTVRWGRIGAAGQTQTKTFATDEEARRASEKCIEAKRKKGYVEIAVETASLVPAKKRAPKRRCQQLLLPF